MEFGASPLPVAMISRSPRWERRAGCQHGMSPALRSVLHRAEHLVADPGDAARRAGGDSLRATAAGLPVRDLRPA